MAWENIFFHIGFANALAFVFFISAWIGYSVFSKAGPKQKNNLLSVMHEYRRAWMREMLDRDNRMVDAAMIGNLLRSVSFFASTSIFILLGLVKMIGYHEKAQKIITAIPFAESPSPLLWEFKIFLLAIIFIYAFFKYTWSLRQYNYACVFVGAAPKPKSQPAVALQEYAERGADLLDNAARHFNMGLRAYYFGLAAMSWFVHPIIFIAITGWVIYVLYRREFLSQTLHVLANPTALSSLPPPTP